MRLYLDMTEECMLQLNEDGKKQNREQTVGLTINHKHKQEDVQIDHHVWTSDCKLGLLCQCMQQKKNKEIFK